MGDRFLNEVRLKIRQILQWPRSFPEKKQSFRETKIDVFPFLLIYRIAVRKKVIVIISVFHTHTQKPYIKVFRQK
ncbi:MAG: type II toxin-antitoxin system RelE/ParE family toxin [Chitinophagaceae bacterium]|nr:type II toxin-antitoxin system RelE/ParE family toxin [Chitinophagaceae bacterium]